jgi:hypothetical protein
MRRLHWIPGLAVLSLLTAVVAVGAALTMPQVPGAVPAASARQLMSPSGSTDRWPQPKAPFDETEITPYESAGAPMVL